MLSLDPFSSDLLNAVATPLLILQDDRIHFANTAALNITQYDTLEGLDCRQLIDVRFHNQIARADQQKNWSTEAVIKTQAGDALWVYLTFKPIDLNARPAQMVTMELARLDAINDNVHEGIYRSTPDNRLLYVSEAFVRMFGFESAGEALQAHPSQFYANPADRDKFLAVANSEGQFQDHEALMVRRDGTEMWVANSGTVVYDPDGNPLFYDGALTDVTPRKQAEHALLEREKLKIALQKERELRRLRDHLMETISHQFRTPLTVILSSSDLVERYYDRMTDEKRQRQLRKIRDQIMLLTEMLDDISLLTEADAAETPMLELNRFDMRDLCLHVMDTVRDYTGSSHVLSLDVDDDDYAVKADDFWMQRALKNLLMNAVKYSQAGTAVQIKLTKAGDQVILAVEDQGIGIPQDDIPHIFEPFHRGQNTRMTQGIGLGLSLVRRAVDYHQGCIEVHSDNHGTAFRVQLPILQPVTDTVQALA